MSTPSPNGKEMLQLQIALYQPRIPQNTGAIGRLCVVSGARLHLIEPLGFSLDDRYLKRAGLDYWSKLNFQLHASLAAFCAQVTSPLYYLSSHAQCCYSSIAYPLAATLLFGNEVDGLPLGSTLLKQHSPLRIPMLAGQRCHNLANSVAIVSYEVLRQHGFIGLC